MHSKRRKFVVLLSLVLLVLSGALMPYVSTSGYASESDNEVKASEVILRVSLQDDVHTLNYLTANDIWTWKVLKWEFDVLTWSNYSNQGHIEPWAAEWFHHGPESTWSTDTYPDNDNNQDFLNWTVKLREDIKWHDWESQETVNQTVHASDVVFSMRLAADVQPYFMDLNCIIARDSDGNMLYGREIDDKTDNGTYYGPNGNWTYGVNVSYQKEYPDLPVILATVDGDDLTMHFRLMHNYTDFETRTLNIPVVPERIWKNHISDKLTWSDPEGLISFGPFKFDFWDPGKQISKIVTFRDYFRPEYDSVTGEQKPYIDAILFKVYGTMDGEIMALTSDKVDYIAGNIDPGFIDTIENNCHTRLVRSNDYSFVYMAFNMRKPEFGYENYDETDLPESGLPRYDRGNYTDSGKPFRVAMAHVVNKQYIVSRFLQGFGSVGTSVVSPVNSFWYNPNIKIYDYDLNEANSILDAHDWKDTDGDGWRELPNIGDNEITMMVPPADYDPIQAQSGLLIQQDAQAVGIHLKSTPTNVGTIRQQVGEKHFDMYIFNMKFKDSLSSVRSPVSLFSSYADLNIGSNYPGYHNESFDRLCEEFNSERNMDKRRNVAYSLQESIAEDVPYSVLYYRDVLEAYNAENLYGWIMDGGTLFNIRSIMNLKEDRHPPNVEDLSGTPLTGKVFNMTAHVHDNETWVCGDQAEIDYKINTIGGSASGVIKNITMDGNNWSTNISIPENATRITYSYIVRDVAGNEYIKTVTKDVFDDISPRILESSASPSKQSQHGNVNITCSATDNIVVSSILINITYPDGNHSEARMERKSPSWYYEQDFSVLGNYTYTLIALDEYGNPSSPVSGHFRIVEDILPPSLEDVTDGVPTTGDYFTVCANISDDTQIYDARVYYRFSDENPSLNMTLVESDGLWQAQIPVDNYAVRMYYYLIAEDGSGNSNRTEEKVLNVVDNDAPIIWNNISDSTYVGSSVQFNVTVKDNIGVGSVYLNFSVGEGPRKNVSMRQEKGDVWTYTFNVSRNSTDNITYHISAIDVNGNWKNTENMTIVVTDNIPPIARAENLTVIEGNTVILDATNSTDNVGISNYTWQISSNDTAIRLYGVSPHLELAPGIYTAHLSVRDLSGNSANTSISITVLKDTDGDRIPDEEDTDDDGDGMPDMWEIQYALNPNNASDASQDTDGDGLTNYMEFEEDTDPTNPDTDGDGIPDGEDAEPLAPASKISGGSNLYLIIALIAIVTGIILFYLKKNGRKSEEEPFEGEPEEEMTEEDETE